MTGAYYGAATRALRDALIMAAGASEAERPYVAIELGDRPVPTSADEVIAEVDAALAKVRANGTP